MFPTNGFAPKLVELRVRFAKHIQSETDAMKILGLLHGIIWKGLTFHREDHRLTARICIRQNQLQTFYRLVEEHAAKDMEVT